MNRIIVRYLFNMLLSWIISLIGFILIFNVVNKQHRKGKNVSVLRKILTILLCVHINWIGSFLLYEGVMELFDIDTDGFMNLNGLLTLVLSWMAVAIMLLILSSYAKELLGSLYRTVRATQLVFASLPIILLIILLFALSFK